MNAGRPKQQTHKTKSFGKKSSIKPKKRPKSLSLKFAQLFKLYLSTFVPFDSISWVRWALVNGKWIGWIPQHRLSRPEELILKEQTFFRELQPN